MLSLNNSKIYIVVLPYTIPMRNRNNWICSGLLLLKLASPVFGQENLESQIGKLEQEIIRSNSASFQSIDYKDYVVYWRSDIPISETEKAGISITYDKRQNKPVVFSLNITGNQDSQMTIAEVYHDGDLNALKKEGRKDLYMGYDPECRCIPKGNKIDYMTNDDLERLNKQYMQRLAQVNSAMTR
jgi:hypothetical protein